MIINQRISGMGKYLTRGIRAAILTLLLIWSGMVGFQPATAKVSAQNSQQWLGVVTRAFVCDDLSSKQNCALWVELLLGGSSTEEGTTIGIAVSEFNNQPLHPLVSTNTFVKSSQQAYTYARFYLQLPSSMPRDYISQTANSAGYRLQIQSANGQSETFDLDRHLVGPCNIDPQLSELAKRADIYFISDSGLTSTEVSIDSSAPLYLPTPDVTRPGGGSGGGSGGNDGRSQPAPTITAKAIRGDKIKITLARGGGTTTKGTYTVRVYDSKNQPKKSVRISLSKNSKTASKTVDLPKGTYDVKVWENISSVSAKPPLATSGPVYLKK